MTIVIIKSGKNPTMKHMNRTHGVQVRSLYDEFNKPRRNIQYIESAAQRADTLTKCFRDVPTWKHVCRLIGLIDSSKILPPPQGMTETYTVPAPETRGNAVVMATTVRPRFQKTVRVPR